MIHTLPNNYIAVQVPARATAFELMPSIGKLTFLNLGIGLTGIDLPSGQWQLIGLASEIGEGRAGEIVDDPVTYGAEQIFTEYRKEYAAMREREGNHVTDYCPKTALESFATLLSSLGLNPSTTIILKRV